MLENTLLIFLADLTSFLKQYLFSDIALLLLTPGPVHWLVFFLAAQGVMIAKLGSVERKGLEGTVTGSLIMPYCSGLPNLMFAYILGSSGGDGVTVLENCLVNNVTNLTLLLGVPALLSPLVIRMKDAPEKEAQEQKINQLSLLLTLTALLFFTAVLWALGRDGTLDFGDGVVLTGTFLFWQILHVFEVLKNNARENQSRGAGILPDIIILLFCAYVTYVSIDQLVAWVPQAGSQWLSMEKLGWISGFLMVLPNGLLAFYYALKGRADIVCSSQIGDGHICIPMCIGMFALFQPTNVPDFFQTGVLILGSAGVVHILLLGFTGKVSRLAGLLGLTAYLYFLYDGFI